MKKSVFIFLMFFLMIAGIIIAAPPLPPPAPEAPTIEENQSISNEIIDLPPEPPNIPSLTITRGANNNVTYKILGDGGSIKSSTVNISVLIEGSENLSRTFDGVKKVEIRDRSASFVEFEFNFSSQILNLSKITISKQNGSVNFGYAIVSGIDTQNTTKTLYLDKVNLFQNGACIKDKEIKAISEISENCNDEDELKIECDGVLQNGYRCTYLNNISIYKITGLKHSGVRQIDYSRSYEASTTSTSTSSGGGSSGGGGGSLVVRESDSSTNISLITGTSNIEGNSQIGAQGLNVSTTSQNTSQNLLNPQSSNPSEQIEDVEATEGPVKTTKKVKNILFFVNSAFGIAIFILLLLLFVNHMKKPKISGTVNQKTDEYLSKLKLHISNSLRQGHSPEVIRQALLRKNWPEDEINKAFKDMNNEGKRVF